VSEQKRKEAPMRSGARTTEFVLSLVAVVVGAFAASGLLPDESPWMRLAGILSSTLAALGYTYARTSLKKGSGP
jgi:hypothetical protein